jgi:cytoskeletal protein RodZ
MSETIGSYLKKEREQRNIPLEELAEQTRIKVPYLHAIESEHFEKLPGLTFAKGYLKAYALYVGLLPEEVLSKFEHYLKKHARASAFPGQGTDLRRFWLVTFMVLLLTAAVIMVWFRK